MTEAKGIFLGANRITIEDLISVVYKDKPVRLAPAAIRAVQKGRTNLAAHLASGRPYYSINTGFGALSGVKISADKLKELQTNLVRSHSAGAGEPFSLEIAKAALVITANSIAKGYSGCRRVLVDTLAAMINEGVIPVIPSQGSIGASGDLIPLAHAAAVMIGEGEAYFKGKKRPAKEAMRKAGIPILKLEPREGIALTNGTHLMTALGALSVHRAERLNKLADIALAMSLESILGLSASLDPDVHRLRPHPGQRATALNVRKMIRGSRLLASHPYSKKIQDAYSLRCGPQIHGASKDALRYCRSVLDAEINSVTDNPLVFGNKVVSAGNFHGQPLAVSLDALGIATTVLGNVSECRIDRYMNPNLSGLPAFLAPDPGLHSGYMMAHYLSAALTLENRGLAAPGSVHSVPVSANKEDYNSNGMWCARKAWQIIRNVENILGIEILCAAQALDFLQERPGTGSAAARKMLREKIRPLKGDRVLQKDINAVGELIDSGRIIEAVEGAVGPLAV
jgi:histidine ammonia-lyase